MLFAPKLEPQGFRGSWFYRLLSGLGLGVGAGIGTALALLLFIAGQFVVATPEQLYHRTWQAAQWMIYDPAAMGDWQSWEHKFDGQIKTNEDAVRFANEMLESLNDRYTRLFSPEEVRRMKEQQEGNFTGIGVVMDIEVDADGNPKVNAKGEPAPAVDKDGNVLVREVIEGSPAQKAGLRSGDAISTIDGVSVRGKSLEELIGMIRNQAGTSIKVESVRDGQAQPAMTITRATVHVPSVTTEMLAGDIGYIKLKGFDSLNATDEMIAGMKKLDDAKAIILDLRDNPGGFVHHAIDISSLFVEEGTLVSIKSRFPSPPSHPVWATETVKVTKTELIRESTTDGTNVLVSKSARKPYMLKGRPLVILVNGHSASASEMTTGAIRDNANGTTVIVVVIGEKTFGKGIGQSMIPMPNGTMMNITSLRYFTPKGVWLGDGGNSVSHGIGPDVEVKPTKKNFKPRSAEDNQFNAAVEYLRSKLSP